MYSRQTAPKAFYDTIMKEWPTLKYNPRLYALVLALMFPMWISKETGNIVLEQEYIAKIVGQMKHLREGNFSAKYWLDQVKELLLRFEYSNYNFDRAREVTVIEWPHAIQKGLDEMKSNYHNKAGDVFLLTGKAVNKRNVTEVRTEDRNYAQEVEKERQKKLNKMAQAGVKEADSILIMLNALKGNMFDRLLDNLDDVWNMALAMSRNTPVEVALRDNVLNLLRLVAIQPQPFYKAVEKSARLYSMNDSILRLPRKLRKLFIADLTTLDLKASQLTIVATDWNIAWLKDFLKNDGNVWRYLFTQLGLDYGLKQSNAEEYERIKNVLKHEGLYPIIYGRNEKLLLTSNYKEYASARKAFESIGTTAEAFLNTEMMREILNARAIKYAEIQKNKGAHDIFGRWIAVEKGTSVSSVASQLAQAVELKLMYPIVQEAFKSSQFEIVIWLHDSVSINVGDKRRLEYWINKLQTVVKEHALTLGYDVELEVE
jgi:hypothetical protein